MENADVILSFRRAETADVQALRGLAHSAEAHWGGGQRFMEIFDRDYNISPAFIAENPVYDAWVDGEAAAFWGLTMTQSGWELEYFYVTAHALGRGYGRQMWTHLTSWCRAHGVTGFRFVTSPQAVGFYQRMGACQDGVTASSIDGRPIPRLLYQLS